MTNIKKIAARALEIPSEGALDTLRAALELESQGVDMVHLEIGEPDFPTPEHIVQAGVASLHAGRTNYTPAGGESEFRAAIAEYLSTTRHLDAQPEQALVMPGGKPTIFFTILALIEAGDEVICPDPGFSAYSAVTDFAGGVTVPMPLRAAQGFRPDIDHLRSLITPRTKLLILNSPGNPTGAVIPRTDLEAIADIVLTHRLWVLSDEIYSQLYYGDTPPPSIASLPGMAERTIILDGFSKSYAMTGWRLGFGLFPLPLVKPVLNIMTNNHSCVAQFVQDAGLAALRGPQDCVEAMRVEYQARRDLIVPALNKISGIKCRIPEGAFYAMPSVSGPGLEDTRAFVGRLLQSGVALLPGTDFGRYGEGYLRISYASSRENLRVAMERIRLTTESLR